MKQALGLGILAVGGYILYQHFFAPAGTVALPATGTATNTNPAANTNAGANTMNAMTMQDLRTSLLLASGYATQLNADQWGYYANSMLAGGAIPADTFGHLFLDPYSGDRGHLYTVDEYLAVLHGAGLAGIHGTSGDGLGRIGAYVLPIAAARFYTAPSYYEASEKIKR